MLIACWSTKGGVGTSVVAAALALLLGRTADRGVVLADLAGDGPAVLGLPEPASPGLAGWLSAGSRVPADALARIEIEVAPGLALLPRGDGPLSAGRAEVLAAVLDGATRTAVVDCGRVDDPAVATVAGRAARSLLVTRSCYVALRRVRLAPVRPSGVVLVTEPGRVLSTPRRGRRGRGPGRRRGAARPAGGPARRLRSARRSPPPLAAPAARRGLTMPTIDARVHQRVLRSTADQPLDDDALAALVRVEAPLLDAADVGVVVERVRARIGGLGPDRAAARRRRRSATSSSTVRARCGSNGPAGSSAPTSA